MRRILLGILLLTVLPLAVFSQARTAERLMPSTVSNLNVGNPPIGSIRYAIDAKRQNGPCEAAGVGETPIGSDALKTPDGWMCSSRAAGAGSATVSSVSAGNLSPLFTTSVATATTTPAITFSLSTQAIKTFLAGPASGSSAAPTFRGIVPGDLITGSVTASRCLRTDGSGNIVVAAADCGAGGGAGDALTTNPLSQFAATTSAQLAGVITNETGSGFLVLGTSPNITTPTGIVKGDVGLSNVDNTSDANKPVSTATQTALDLKAPLASPTFTGTVTIPTPFTLGAVSVLPTGTELNFVDGVTSAIQTQLDNKQPLDSDLTTLAGLTVTTDNFIIGVASAWASRTPAQAKTALAIAFTDVSGSVTDAQVPNNITVDVANSGDSANAFFPSGTLETGIGGTGVGTPAEDQVLVGNGTTFQLKTLPSCSNATNDKLLYNSTTNAVSCGTDQTTGGGSGITTLNTLTPATQTLSKTDDTNVTLTITSSGSDHNFALGWAGTLAKARQHAATVYTDQANDFGAFLQRFETGANFRFRDPTDLTKTAGFDLSNIATGTNRTVTFPNADSTTVVPDTGAANNFLTAISATGAISKAQPAFSNISGSITAAQAPDAVADGATKGVASFTAADFNATSGNISLDYTNGQAASGSNKGFLTSVDWTTFNAKVGTSTTDTLTNKTLDVEGTGNSLTTVHKTWLTAAGCNNATASSFWDLGTSLAPTPACKNSSSGATAQNAALDFPDSDGMYFGQSQMMLPEDFTGTVDAKIKWMAAATSGDVIWNVSTICVADAEVDNPSFNTVSTVTDTAKGTTLQTNDAAITTVTITGCSAGELMHVKISRDRTTSGDTITGVVSFLGLQLTTRRAQ